jgi:endonuclease YncB( thermonuclease family)
MNFIRKLCKFSGKGQSPDIELETSTYDSVQPFIPVIKTGKIVKVYDGDTVTISARIYITETQTTKLFRFNVRLRGIDSPEIKTKNDKERSLAIVARDKLRDLIMNQIVSLQNVQYDKYGRILADIVTKDGKNVSDWMLGNDLVVKYDGGTKHKPSEWI